jgi:hypothetical protein
MRNIYESMVGKIDARDLKDLHGWIIIDVKWICKETE